MTQRDIILIDALKFHREEIKSERDFHANIWIPIFMGCLSGMLTYVSIVGVPENWILGFIFGILFIYSVWVVVDMKIKEKQMLKIDLKIQAAYRRLLQ